MSEHEPGDERHPHESPLLHAQEHKGYGDDEGEREESFEHDAGAAAPAPAETTTVLFAYDGSESANAAIATAARLLGRHDVDAVVLSVWEPLVVDALRAARFGGWLAVPPNAEVVDERSEQQARSLAEHGARVASELGFHARPLSVADEREIADTIVASAQELEVDLIVLGARGLTGVRAFLGSVSNHVLQHARRPVLVVPTAP